MAVAGLALLGIGSVGVLAAAVAEMRTHEPAYKLMMKVFPWLMAVGGVLTGVSMGG